MRHHVQLTISILILLAVAKAAEEPAPPGTVPSASQCKVSLMQTDLRMKTLKEEAAPHSPIKLMAESERKLPSNGHLEGTVPSSFSQALKDVGEGHEKAAAPAQQAEKDETSTKSSGELKVSSDSEHLVELKASSEYARRQQATSKEQSKTIDVRLNSELETESHTKASSDTEHLVELKASSMYQILAADDLTMIHADEPHEKSGALATCLPLVILLCVGWTLKFAMKDRFQTGGLLYISLVSVSFCAASISMHTLNKACVSLTGAPSTLTSIQMAVAVAATLAFQWKEFVGADRKKLRWWCIVPVFYAGMLNSSLFSYQYISLSLMIVFRNLAPLVTMTVERFVMDAQHAPKVTLPVVLAIMVMVIGALLFTTGESDASYIGLVVVLLNTLLAVADRLVQRRLLVSECKDLPLSACMILNNSVGMLPTFVMAMAMHEVQTIPANQAAWTDPATLLLIGLSGMMGMAIGFFGLMCQQAMTATSFQVLQNLSKIFLVFVSVCVFGDNMDSHTRQAGMVLSIVGSVAYGLARASETTDKDAGSGERQALEKMRPAAGNIKATDQAK